MTLEDRTYYLRRALQEDQAAAIATCTEARERHLELAAAYRLRCRADGQSHASPDDGTLAPVVMVTAA